MNIDYNNNCNTELNCSITAEEVVLAMKSLKNKTNIVVLIISLMKC